MTENRSPIQAGFDIVKWIVAIGMVLSGIYANAYVYAAEPALYRALGLLLVVMVAAGIVMTTVQGKAFWLLAKNARIEIRRVVWPTRIETVQTTALVIAVTLLMALILWLLDTLLSWAVSYIIG